MSRIRSKDTQSTRRHWRRCRKPFNWPPRTRTPTRQPLRVWAVDGLERKLWRSLSTRHCQPSLTSKPSQSLQTTAATATAPRQSPVSCGEPRTGLPGRLTIGCRGSMYCCRCCISRGNWLLSNIQRKGRRTYDGKFTAPAATLKVEICCRRAVSKALVPASSPARAGDRDGRRD